MQEILGTEVTALDNNEEPSTPADSSVTTTAGPHVSPRKLAANRRNAARSTGPKTERGKRHSRTNRIRHGVYSQLALQDLQHVRGFDNAQQLLAQLEEHYPPRTLAERVRLETLALDLWRRSRAAKVELELTDNNNAFFNPWVANVVRFSSAVHRMTDKSFAVLEQLDRQAAELSDDGATADSAEMQEVELEAEPAAPRGTEELTTQRPATDEAEPSGRKNPAPVIFPGEELAG